MICEVPLPVAPPVAASADHPCPDVYFTAGYGLAAAVAEPGTWQRWDFDGALSVPFVRKSIPTATGGQPADAVSPYGYSGIWFDPASSRRAIDQGWKAALDHWREAGVVSVFLRFSPLDVGAIAVAGRLAGISLTQRSDTITVPVRQGSERLWRGMLGRSRTAIRKARHAGLTAAIRPVRPDDLRPDAPFRRLYQETMARVGSAPGYWFPDEYYRLLLSGCARWLLLAEVRDPAGEVVAAALVLRFRDRAHYHLSGSNLAAGRNGANNLLLWTILEWAAQHGCALVHLGGGVRADDGLFRFKQSFGGIRTPFWTGAVITEPRRYRSLLAERASLLATTTGDLEARGFFPGYRVGGR